ncbi:type II toxin-antitoxin system MqsA family antitoxin [Myxococcota bacterium]|nr:type II toxin-antitoxin system MqsA family antitoxin [Myxococcota bacterium]MBU1897664.1 type II toxin-antitoxin system MqsA family antitoxin [Myxococcota bacterium]
MSEIIKCHACGADMSRDVRPDEVIYKAHIVSIEQPGWYCEGCDEVVLSAEDAQIADEVFIRLRVEVEGLLSRQEIARIREKLNLSQRQAGAELGGGPRAFYKYESGISWVSRPMANLLRLLDHDPSALEIIRANAPRHP